MQYVHSTCFLSILQYGSIINVEGHTEAPIYFIKPRVISEETPLKDCIPDSLVKLRIEKGLYCE